MPRCLIGLGANLGDRHGTLASAVELLASLRGLRTLAVSPWLETLPRGGPVDQPLFLNAAVLAECDLPPRELWTALATIENRLGRTRQIRWEPRILDIDLLLYGEHVIQEQDLMVPHPRMACRGFVLEPAQRICPDMVVPTLGWTIEQLWTHLLDAPRYLAIAGAPRVGKTTLACRVAHRLGAKLVSDASAKTLDEAGTRDALRNSAGRLALQHELVKHAAINDGTWIVSDFWSQSATRPSVPRQEVLETSGGIPEPKLLVLLSHAASADGTANHELARQADEGWLQVIHQRAAERRQGPWLRLFNGDLDQAVDETVACIEAMS